MKLKNCIVGLNVIFKASADTVVFGTIVPIGTKGTITRVDQHTTAGLGICVQWAGKSASVWEYHKNVRKVKEVATVEPLKVGDNVRVLPFTVHKATNGINYWESMLKCIHEVGTIDCTSDTGFHVKTISGSWFYGAEYLERV